MTKLVEQAVDRKGRYKPVTHEQIKPGDIVLLKEVYSKQCDYPMAPVTEIVENCLGEVTGIVAMKGSTGETVKRDSSGVIPLLTLSSDNNSIAEQASLPRPQIASARPTRKAAVESRDRVRALYDVGDA